MAFSIWLTIYIILAFVAVSEIIFQSRSMSWSVVYCDVTVNLMTYWPFKEAGTMWTLPDLFSRFSNVSVISFSPFLVLKLKCEMEVLNKSWIKRNKRDKKNQRHIHIYTGLSFIRQMVKWSVESGEDLSIKKVLYIQKLANANISLPTIGIQPFPKF